MSQLAMLAILKDQEGKTTNVITIQAGERLEFGRYTDKPTPHVKVRPVNGGGSSFTTYEFSGKVVIQNALGTVIEEVEASLFMEQSKNG